MLSNHLVDATGVIALALNVSGYVRPCDRTLRTTTGWAAALWAVNNFLMGAQTAALLSVLSAGRQATASVVINRPARIKALVFAVIVALTLAVAALTWTGAASLFTAVGSLAASYAMLYLRGVALRVAMLVVAVCWMVNGLVYDSAWQVMANGLAGGAAVIGAWRARKIQSEPTQTSA